jgi:hypothetical protein
MKTRKMQPEIRPCPTFRAARRPNAEMPGRVDGEIRVAPAVQPVQRTAILHCPLTIALLDAPPHLLAPRPRSPPPAPLPIQPPRSPTRPFQAQRLRYPLEAQLQQLRGGAIMLVAQSQSRHPCCSCAGLRSESAQPRHGWWAKTLNPHNLM